MKLFNRRPICNNNPNSAPMIDGVPFLLCWRCTGAVLGIATGLILQKIIPSAYDDLSSLKLVVIFSLPALIDFSLNRLRLKKESNIMRFITGVSLGLAIAQMEIIVIFRLCGIFYGDS